MPPNMVQETTNMSTRQKRVRERAEREKRQAKQRKVDCGCMGHTLIEAALPAAQKINSVVAARDLNLFRDHAEVRGLIPPRKPRLR